MIKIGDKVRFLDSVGGGIVRRFSGKDLVMVEDEDGFEMPTQVSQCVVVSDEDDARASGNVQPKEAPKPTKQTRQPAPTATRIQDSKTSINLDKPVRSVETKEGDVLNLFLSFIPADDRRLQESSFYCYLVNDSNYWTFFTLLSPKGDGSEQMECRYTGLIEPNTKQQLFCVDRSKVGELDDCAVQLIAFKRDRPFMPQSPMHIDLHLNSNRFYKLHSFIENDFFEQDALMQPVVKEGRPYLPMKLDEEAISRSIREKVNAQKNAVKKPVKPVIERNGIIEIDLHIAELVDTTAGMSNADMLQYQMETFRKTMNTYRTNRGQKIVFIHGKGEGVLRKAIIDELKAHYQGCEWQDASFQQYGFGATQVTIHSAK